MAGKSIEISDRELDIARIRSERILSYGDLKSRGIKFSRQWIMHLMRAGKFPRTVTLGQGHSVGFVESEIDAWIANLIRERDEQEV
jgi:predicted DNA-binding transcriptional regulator AlpA